MAEELDAIYRYQEIDLQLFLAQKKLLRRWHMDLTLSGLDYLQKACPCDGLVDRRCIEFALGQFEIKAHRVLRDLQSRGDALGNEAARQKFKALLFPSG